MKKWLLITEFSASYQDLMRQALACNGSATLVPYVGSKTEIALLEYLQNRGEDYEALRTQYFTPRLYYVPILIPKKEDELNLRKC